MTLRYAGAVLRSVVHVAPHAACVQTSQEEAGDGLEVLVESLEVLVCANTVERAVDGHAETHGIEGALRKRAKHFGTLMELGVFAGFDGSQVIVDGIGPDLGIKPNLLAKFL